MITDIVQLLHTDEEPKSTLKVMIMMGYWIKTGSETRRPVKPCRHVVVEV